MSLSEFSLIEQYFTDVGARRGDVVLGVGDDGALLTALDGHHLVTATRTVHIDAASPAVQGAAAVAHGLAGAAMTAVALQGGRPAWITLAMSLPTVDEPWLADFAASLAQVCQTCGVALVGGDTTRGPWRVTVVAHGQRPDDLPRPSPPRAGDLIYVSGALGEPGLALLDRYGEINLPRVPRERVRRALDHPRPGVETALALAGMVSAMSTLENGLANHLQDLLDPHGLGATLHGDDLPVATELRPHLAQAGGRDLLLQASSGLVLCLVVDPDRQAAVEARCADRGTGCTWVGLVDRQPGVRCDD